MEACYEGHSDQTYLLQQAGEWERGIVDYTGTDIDNDKHNMLYLPVLQSRAMCHYT